MRRLSWLLVILVLLPTLGWGATSAKWETAVVFLGAGEAAEYQSDVDQNLMELARMPVRQRLGILREFDDHVTSYFPDPKSSVLSKWDALFFKPPVAGIDIPGEMNVFAKAKVLQDEALLAKFLRSAFSDPSAHRILVIYGHGEGFKGMKALPLLKLQALLEKVLPKRSGAPLDILWMNSCFMANTEAAYQLRELAPFYLASEDAEFSAGAPFDTLQNLPGKDARAAALDLAESYLESYSYVAKGDQRKAVFESAATISVTETAKLEGLVNVLKKTSTLLKSTIKDLARKRKKIVMQRDDLVDLGALALQIGDSELAQYLELSGGHVRKSNPRLPVFAPAQNSNLVFGYEGWTRGSESDSDVLDRLPKQLQPTSFVAGPDDKKLPSRNVHIRLYLNPFTVSFNEFDYYFVDASGKPLTEKQAFVRTSDYFTYTAKGEQTPVIFSGYVQSKGAAAEIYNGISILNPLTGIPTTTYPDSDFSKATDWGNF